MNETLYVLLNEADNITAYTPTDDQLIVEIPAVQELSAFLDI